MSDMNRNVAFLCANALSLFDFPFTDPYAVSAKGNLKSNREILFCIDFNSILGASISLVFPLLFEISQVL